MTCREAIDLVEAIAAGDVELTGAFAGACRIVPALRLGPRLGPPHRSPAGRAGDASGASALHAVGHRPDSARTLALRAGCRSTLQRRDRRGGASDGRRCAGADESQRGDDRRGRRLARHRCGIDQRITNRRTYPRNLRERRRPVHLRAWHVVVGGTPIVTLSREREKPTVVRGSSLVARKTPQATASFTQPLPDSPAASRRAPKRAGTVMRSPAPRSHTRPEARRAQATDVRALASRPTR